MRGWDDLDLLALSLLLAKFLLTKVSIQNVLTDSRFSHRKTVLFWHISFGSSYTNQSTLFPRFIPYPTFTLSSSYIPLA